MSKLKPKEVNQTADLNLGHGSFILYKKKFIQPHLASETGTIFRQLMDETKFEQKDLVVLGKKVKQPRLLAYYATDIERGSFTYTGLRNIPSHFTPFVEQLKNSVQEYVKEEFDSVLLNYYRDGSDTVGWHADNEKLYGDEPTIASLSFGSARDFFLRKIDDHNNKYKFVLGPGDLLIMKGKVQQQWQHTVPRRSPPQSIGPRINLTFRRIVHPESQTRSPKQPARLPQQPPPQAAFPNLQALAPLFPNPSATESVSSPSKKLACHSTQSLLDPRVWQLRIEQQEQNKLRGQAALLQQAKAGQQASQHDHQQQLPQQLPQQQLQQPEQQQQQLQQQQQQQQEAPLAVSSSMTRHKPPSREPSPPPKMSRFESQVKTQRPDPST